MKIYIVTDGEYSDYHIEAVFTDKKKAEIYASLHNCDWVEEFETHDDNITGDVEPWCIHSFICSSSGLIFLESHYSIKKIHTVRNDFRGITVFVSLNEFDEEKALKIAQDMLAEFKAGKML